MRRFRQAQSLIGLLAGMAWVAFVLAGCLDPRGGVLTRGVQIHLGERTGPSDPVLASAAMVWTPLTAGVSSGQIGTSLIIAVMEDTQQTPYFERIPEQQKVDQNLLDLTSSTVTLELPLDSPLQLLEYTFNDHWSLEGLVAARPIAGTPNLSPIFIVTGSTDEITLTLPLLSNSFTEDFVAAPNPLHWEELAGAPAPGGGWEVAAAYTHDPLATPEANREGQSVGIRSNTNLLLNSQRLAGILRVETATLADSPGAAEPASVRVMAALRYQPRSARASGRTGSTTVQLVMAYDGVGFTLHLEAVQCLTEGCADPATGERRFALASFSTTVAGPPTMDFPFVLEHLGGGVFAAAFDSEVQTLNLGALGWSLFDGDDFRHAEVMAQAGYSALDAGDNGAITAVLSEVQVGRPPNAGQGFFPRVASATLPLQVYTGSIDNPLLFDIQHTGPVDVAFTASAGAVRPVTVSAHDPASGQLAAVFDAPLTDGPVTLDVTVTDISHSVLSVRSTFSLWSVTVLTDPGVTLIFAPAITGISFVRTATDLAVSISTDQTSGLTYTWSGTGTFAGITGSTNTVVLSPYNETTDSGDLTVTVTNAAGVSTTYTHTINLGDFSDPVVVSP